jgi:putative transposase
VEWQNHDLSISRQADLLSVSRSGLYYQPRPISATEVTLKHRMDELYTDFPFYGSRRIAAQLKREGHAVCRETVRRYMQEMGLEAMYPKPHLSQPHPEQKVYPYLLRSVTIATPNQVWGTDITYIRLRHGWLYLVVFLDWYSRYVVSWQLSDTLEVEFVVQALEEALGCARPIICNSDQGSQFTSGAYLSCLERVEVKISMDGRGRAMDNIFTERFWRSLKYDEVYPKEYGSPREARQGLGAYMKLYNERRLHESLGYHTPFEVYSGQVKVPPIVK